MTATHGEFVVHVRADVVHADGRALVLARLLAEHAPWPLSEHAAYLVTSWVAEDGKRDARRSCGRCDYCIDDFPDLCSAPRSNSV